MGIPARPLENVLEGIGTCVIAGRELRWTNCTPAAFADLVERVRVALSKPLRVTACGLRKLSGDTSGGTRLTTIAAVVRSAYGISIEVRDGSNIATPKYLVGQLRAGRPMVVQGNTSALLHAKTLDGHSLRETRTGVNHAVEWNEGRGWSKHADGSWWPKEILAYDPAADGRTAGWGKAAKGPQWWPLAVALAFLAALHPWGEADPRILGSGKAYAALGPDTEPHVHLRFAGSTKTNADGVHPFPRTMTVEPPSRTRINERSGPSTSYPVVTSLPRGATFSAYQVNASGQLLAGSRTWYGDHDGRRWVHSSGVR